MHHKKLFCLHNNVMLAIQRFGDGSKGIGVSPHGKQVKHWFPKINNQRTSPFSLTHRNESMQRTKTRQYFIPRNKAQRGKNRCVFVWFVYWKPFNPSMLGKWTTTALTRTPTSSNQPKEQDAQRVEDVKLYTYTTSNLGGMNPEMLPSTITRVVLLSLDTWSTPHCCTTT